MVSHSVNIICVLLTNFVVKDKQPHSLEGDYLVSEIVVSYVELNDPVKLTYKEKVEKKEKPTQKDPG